MSRITGSTKFVQKLMEEHSHELMMALKGIGETLAVYSRACLDAGASGIFFATVEWGSADNISLDSYDMFCRPFDMTVLEAVREAPFNVFHVCRNNNHLRALLDYPVAAFNWDVAGEGNPSLSEVMSETSAAVMGAAATLAIAAPVLAVWVLVLAVPVPVRCVPPSVAGASCGRIAVTPFGSRTTLMRGKASVGSIFR